MPTQKRTRRTPEQMIEDLQQEIERLKHKAAEQKVKKDPALRPISQAVRAVDKAVAATQDAATKKALVEARGRLLLAWSSTGPRCRRVRPRRP